MTTRRPVSDLQAVVAGLSFDEDRSELIRGIEPGKWKQLLRLTDEAQLTLPLGLRRMDCLPDVVRNQVERNLSRNAQRSLQTRTLYREAAQELRWRGVDFLVLKGMTHFPLYCDDLAHRPQFDIDFYCPPESVHAAAEAMRALGYEPVEAGPGQRPDHLPAMIRKTGFKWRGDYYDPDLPLIIEPHFRFWNAGREGFEVSEPRDFQERRVIRNIGDCLVPTLHPADDLAYTTWHLVKHVLHGNLRLYHVYELAWFLEKNAHSDVFWAEWNKLRTGVRVAEPIAFRLAREWFGCRLHSVVQEEIDSLPHAVDRWFRMFAFSPVTGMEVPNKDELFLHLALVNKPIKRLRIAMHKLVPMNPPKVVLDAHSTRNGPILTLRRFAHRAFFLLRRAQRHIGAWLPIARSGLRWLRAGWRPA